MNFNRINLTTGTVAVLSLIAVSAIPVQAEIAQRNIYRDSTATSVDANSAAEFARIYSTVQSKAMTEESTGPQLSQNPDLGSGLASKEFERYLSKEFEFKPTNR